MLIGCLSLKSFRLLSMVMVSSWNVSGSLRFFSCSTDSLRVRVIAGAKVAVCPVMACLSFWSLWLHEFFAPSAGAHTHFLLWQLSNLSGIPKRLLMAGRGVL